jgi:predicted transcriptional regulator
MVQKRRAESREGMVVTSVALPPDLHRRLAIAALDEHAAINELVRTAIREYLERREAQGRRPKR